MAGSSSKKGQFPVRRSKKSAELLSRQQVKQMIASSIAFSQELKRYVVAFTGVTTSTAGSITPITQGVIQGDSLTTRDGDQLILKQLIMRYQLALNTGNSTSQRVIIFSDNQANGATPTVTDVLNSASWITGYNPVTFQSGRFKVWHDEYVVTTLSGHNAVNDKVWKFNLKHKITYLDVTNNATANGKGAMFVLFIADGANSLFSASFELHFTDS